MRIAVITQYFTPEPSRIPPGVAHGLAARGHSVRVVTGFPNYPEGRLHDGFRQRLAVYERHGQITVRRVPIVISHSNNPLGRAANYVSFALSSLLARRFVRDADVVYVYATQMTAAFAPSVWRRLGGPPVVLHVQDLWPESITESSLVRCGPARRVVAGALSRWTSGIYRRASGLIAIAPTMSRLLAERGADPDKIEVIFNWAPESADDPRPAPAESKAGLTVVYAGNVGDMQNLEVAVEAARLIEADTPGFRLIIVGTGVAEQRLKEAASGLTNVEFRGRVPLAEMPPVYAESDFQLITLRDLPIFRGTIPSKFQASLASGVPVITSVAGDVASIVREASVGLIADPENPESLASAFRDAYSMPRRAVAEMGRRARDLYVSSMSADQGIERIEQLLVRVVQRTRMGGRS